MKILIKPQPKHPHHHHIWSSVYFYILYYTILLYKFGLPYLPSYQKKFCANFFLKKLWLQNTLPINSLDICPNIHSIFFGPSPKISAWHSFGPFSYWQPTHEWVVSLKKDKKWGPQYIFSLICGKSSEELKYLGDKITRSIFYKKVSISVEPQGFLPKCQNQPWSFLILKHFLTLELS